MGDFNTKKLQQKIDLKKLQIEDNIRTFLQKFSQTNKMIFSKLIDTLNNEENNMVGSLEFMKNRIKVYLNEEMLLNNKAGNNNHRSSENKDLPVSDSNFRKGGQKDTKESES